MRFLALVLIAACSPMVYTHGVPNYAIVDKTESGDPYVVRSGQITTQEGWDFLKTVAHGRHVHVVKLNFDNEGSDQLAVAMGFDVVYVPIEPAGDRNPIDAVGNTFRKPDPENIAKAKSTLLYCKLHPDTELCDIHCTHGQDRTSEVTGEYRVEHDGWAKLAAYQEMLDHHYHPELHALHERWEAFHVGAN